MSSPDQPESQLTRKQLRELRMTGATPIVTPAEAAADATPHVGEPEATASDAPPQVDAGENPQDAAHEPGEEQPSGDTSASAPAAADDTQAADADPIVTVDDVPISSSTPGEEDAQPGAQNPAAQNTEQAPVDLDAVPRTRRQAREQERIRTASVPVITPDEPIAVPVVETPEPAQSQPWWKPKGSAAKRAAAEEAAAEAAADVPAEVDQSESVTAAEPADDTAEAAGVVEEAAVEDAAVEEASSETTPDDVPAEGVPADDVAADDVAADDVAADDVAADESSADESSDDESSADEPSTAAANDDVVESSDDDAAGDEPEQAIVVADTPTESDTTTDDAADVTDTTTPGANAATDTATDSEGEAAAKPETDTSEAKAQRPLLQPKFGQSVAEPEVAGATLPPSFDELIARNGGGGSTSTSNTLIVSQTPSIASLTAPVTATGEVLITGTFALPEGLGSQGHAPGVTDGKDIDVVLLDGELPAASSPTPIAASAAVSQVKAPGDIIRPPAPEKTNKTMIALAITAGVLAVGVIGIIIYAITSGVIG